MSYTDAGTGMHSPALSGKVFPKLFWESVHFKRYVTYHGGIQMRVTAIPFCPNCGKNSDARKRFCENCGAPLSPVPAVPPQAAPPGTPVAMEKTVEKIPGAPFVPPARLPRTGEAVPGEFLGSLSWQRKIPLITNPWLVLQGIAIPLLIGLFLGGFFWLITGEGDMLVLFLVIGAALSALFLVIMLVLQLATGGGLDTEFFISSTGVAHQAGSTTRTLDRAATAGSLLGGSFSGAGSGLIATSQESNMLAWADVRYVSVYRNVRSIVFRSPYLISPVVLYCTEENFPVVLAMVKRFAPPGTTGNL
jgi:hypothetical protein